MKPRKNPPKISINKRHPETIRKPRKPHIWSRVCIWRGETFRTEHPNQRVCDPCREQGRPDYICECGSYISGRSKWGDEWGGECDRAEEITSRLMVALGKNLVVR